MTNDAEDQVSEFYNTVGWGIEGEVTEDARRWEDLRENARDYVSQCRLRVLRHIPAGGGNFLDMASGPIQYKEYLEFSRNFSKRYCVDLSATALEQARRRIGDHGVFLHGSFFDVALEENFFDCTVSLHTIYHMHQDRQEAAVRKLIRVTRPGQPVIVVYRNPRAIAHRVESSLPFRVVQKARRILKRTRADPASSAEKKGSKVEPADDVGLYFFLHPLSWWDRFRDVADVEVLPWRSFLADTQKALIPDNRVGKKMFSVLFRLEDRFSGVFARHFDYPMIVIRKRASL